MPFPSALVESIRDKLDTGSLRTDLPPKMYAGYGHGYQCAVCAATIQPGQVEYEMDYGSDVIFRLHLACAGLWEAECLRRGHRAA